MSCSEVPRKAQFRREAPGRNRRQFVVANGGSGLEESHQSNGEAELQRNSVFSKKHSGLKLEETAESAVELADLGVVEVDGVEQPPERTVHQLFGKHQPERASRLPHRTGLPEAS